uniref:Putative secreted protein n=1 Tax=Anopheles triannulatus TaxID=58253 RepID=A0A2M4B245_9DIPT
MISTSTSSTIPSTSFCALFIMLSFVRVFPHPSPIAAGSAGSLGLGAGCRRMSSTIHFDIWGVCTPSTSDWQSQWQSVGSEMDSTSNQDRVLRARHMLLFLLTFLYAPRHGLHFLAVH